MIEEIAELDGVDLSDPDAVADAIAAVMASEGGTRAVALTVLGQALVDTGSSPYIELGLEALLEASEAGVSVASFSAGLLLLEHGHTEEGLGLLESAARAGLVPAQRSLGALLIQAGEGRAGLEFLAAAATDGDAESADLIAQLLSSGEVFGSLDAEDAAELLEGAADAGVPGAEQRLLEHLADRGEFEPLVTRLGAIGDRRRLRPALVRELGAGIAESNPDLVWEAAIALAPQEDDVRRAFLNGILLGASTFGPSDESDLRLALALESPLS